MLSIQWFPPNSNCCSFEDRPNYYYCLFLHQLGLVAAAAAMLWRPASWAILYGGLQHFIIIQSRHRPSVRQSRGPKLNLLISVGDFFKSQPERERRRRTVKSKRFGKHFNDKMLVLANLWHNQFIAEDSEQVLNGHWTTYIAFFGDEMTKADDWGIPSILGFAKQLYICPGWN